MRRLTLIAPRRPRRGRHGRRRRRREPMGREIALAMKMRMKRPWLHRRERKEIESNEGAGELSAVGRRVQSGQSVTQHRTAQRRRVCLCHTLLMS